MSLPNCLKIPPLLQKLQWIVDPIGYLEKAAQQHADMFTAEVIGFGDTAVFVHHPQVIQEIFTNDRKKFIAVGELNKSFKPIMGDNSLLMLDGEGHKRRRQLLIPPFHGERMRAYGKLICDITEKIFSQLPIHQPFLACSVMQEISLEVILHAVFGLHEGERYQKIKHLMVSTFDMFKIPLNASYLLFPSLQKDLGNWSPWGRFVRQRQQIHELLYEEIVERHQQDNPERIDILSLLMAAKDEAGQSMTYPELRDELMTLMFAGYETTAKTMAWALYWIHYLPEVREKILQELDTLEDSSEPMNIFRLPYLTAVCNESLRIYPVAMFTPPRVTQEPVELLGHCLEPGTPLFVCIHLTHQREDLYPQHDQFRPERFLERQFTPFEFLPFGGGARGCVGSALAMFEMKLVLGQVLSHYQFALVDKQPERPQRQGFSIGPANGVKMMIMGRRNHQESQLAVATIPAF